MITFYSIIWTLINCILMAFIIFILRSRTSFLAKFGTSVLNILTVFCIIRILFPIEFPEHQYVIADSYIFAKLFKPINSFLFPVFPDWFLPFLAVVWAGGSMFHIIRLFVKSRKSHTTIRSNACMENVRGTEALASIDPSCRLPVRTCPGIAVPVLAGYIKPGIYLPDYPYSDQELHYIILHEYTHWKRKDIWKQFFINAVCVIVWWNPAVYSIRQAVSQLLEYNCDKALSLNISEEDVVDYLETLRRSLMRMQEPSINTSIYTIEFVSISKRRKKTIHQRFGLLLNRNTAIRKKLLPKCIIVLIGAIWMVCSYYFILQTHYKASEYSMRNDDLTDQSVTGIANEKNAYLVEQSDGTYIFYFEDFSIEVSTSDVENGLYDYYPIIKYEKDNNFMESIVSYIIDFIKE